MSETPMSARHRCHRHRMIRCQYRCQPLPPHQHLYNQCHRWRCRCTWPLLIPLESRLEDKPDQEESSVDSSESEMSLSGESADREPTAEPVSQPSKTLDITLNFRLGHSGTQVMAQYSRPKPGVGWIPSHQAVRGQGAIGYSGELPLVLPSPGRGDQDIPGPPRW